MAWSLTKGPAWSLTKGPIVAWSLTKGPAWSLTKGPIVAWSLTKGPAWSLTKGPLCNGIYMVFGKRTIVHKRKIVASLVFDKRIIVAWLLTCI